MLFGGSRKIPEGKRVKKDKVLVKEKRVLVIDEDGANLGEMDRDMAIKLSQSKGLEIVLVHKEMQDRCAVYRMMSKKQLYEEEKMKKQSMKKDPRQVTKEITLTTRIASHDFAVKVAHMRDILTKLHNVHVVVEMGRIPKQSGDFDALLKAEKEKQMNFMEEIANELTGVGAKVSKENTRGNKLHCTFKSVVQGDHK